MCENFVQDFEIYADFKLFNIKEIIFDVNRSPYL